MKSSLRQLYMPLLISSIAYTHISVELLKKEVCCFCSGESLNTRVVNIGPSRCFWTPPASMVYCQDFLLKYFQGFMLAIPGFKPSTKMSVLLDANICWSSPFYHCLHPSIPIVHLSWTSFDSHNIFTDDHSRVILQPVEDDPSSDYINANYIDVSRWYSLVFFFPASLCETFLHAIPTNWMTAFPPPPIKNKMYTFPCSPS